MASPHAIHLPIYIDNTIWAFLRVLQFANEKEATCLAEGLPGIWVGD